MSFSFETFAWAVSALFQLLAVCAYLLSFPDVDGVDDQLPDMPEVIQDSAIEKKITYSEKRGGIAPGDAQKATVNTRIIDAFPLLRGPGITRGSAKWATSLERSGWRIWQTPWRRVTSKPSANSRLWT